MVQEINTRGWGILEIPNEVINLDIFREFYANAKPIEEIPLANVSWVWGRRVPCDRDVMHAYLEDNNVENFIRLDPFTVQLAKRN